MQEYKEAGDSEVLLAAAAALADDIYPDRESALFAIAESIDDEFSVPEGWGSLINCVMSHYLKHRRGDSDERHDAEIMKILVMSA